MNNILSLIGRNKALFTGDLAKHENKLTDIVSESSFLVLGGLDQLAKPSLKKFLNVIPRNYML